MKTSEIIREAVKRHLHDGWPQANIRYYEKHTNFICCAIDWSKLGTEEQRMAVCSLIQQRLGRQVTTLEHWLIVNYQPFNHFRFTADNLTYRQQLQAYRARWAESIAAEYEAKGD